MARKRRGSALLRWLVCFGLPIGLLSGAFNTGWYERVTHWPFGISPKEVSLYAQVFDVRQRVTPSTAVEEWTIITGGHTSKKKRKKLSDADWRAAAFQTEGYMDSVEIRRMTTVEGGWEVRFPKDNYFRTQRRLALLPANEGTRKMQEACGIAAALKLAVPEREEVRVMIDGDASEFVAEEHMDAIFLDKRGFSDAALFTQGFNAAHPERWRPDTGKDSALAEEIIVKEQAIMQGAGDLSDQVDLDAAAAWLLMCDLEGRRDMIMDEAVFAYDRANGRIVPLYRPQHDHAEWRSAGIPVANIFSALLARSEFRDRMEKQRQALKDGQPQMLLHAATQEGRLQWLAQALPEANASPTSVSDEAGSPIGNTLADIGRRVGAAVSGDTLSFVRGKYKIDEDLVTPPGTTLILGKGTRWFIAPGKRVEVNGTIIMNGTGPNPVFIRPTGDGPHGGITVNGTDGNRCVISGLQMSGGGSKEGMLVFRNTDVAMTKCILNGSSSALVTIQKGAVEISGCAFMRSNGDGLHLTNCTGKVEACTFQGTLGQVAGTGLRVAGGRAMVNECQFGDLPGTGLSIGNGAETLAMGSRITNCAIGVAAMDGAKCYLKDLVIASNRTGLSASRTQQHRNGAEIVLVDCELTGNEHERNSDAVSKVTSAGTLDPKVLAAFGVSGHTLP